MGPLDSDLNKYFCSDFDFNIFKLITQKPIVFSKLHLTVLDC